MPLNRLDRTVMRTRLVRKQERAGSSDSRFRPLSGTTGHRLLGTQRPQMLCVAAWVWFCLSTDIYPAPGASAPGHAAASFPATPSILEPPTYWLRRKKLHSFVTSFGENDVHSASKSRPLFAFLIT